LIICEDRRQESEWGQKATLRRSRAMEGRGEKMVCWKAVGGGFWRKMVMLNYTHLHAFIAFYHLFLGVNVTGFDGLTAEAQRRRADPGLITELFAVSG
jgi:hypothetical protein